MFTTKAIPATAQDGKIKTGIEIKKGVLYVGGSLKFEDGKWYQLGEDEKWYFLGLGANPAFMTEKEGVANETLFNGAFEEAVEC